MAEQQHDPKDLRMMPFFHRSTETVQYRGVDVPIRFDVVVKHPTWSTGVTLTVTVDSDTGPALAGVVAEDGQATLREAMDFVVATGGMDDLLTAATAIAAGYLAALRVHGPDVDLAELTEQQRVEFDSVRDAVWSQARPVVRPQRRRRMTRKLLREVAEVYRSALADGEAPTKAVARHFTVAHSTAGRWVGEARKAGELGPATGPTPGEATEGG